MNSRRPTIVSLIILSLIVVCLPAGLLFGSVDLSASEIIDALCGNGSDMTRFVVVETRLPALITSLLAGAALAVAGLLMQTCFDNPLAGPSIMGISSGASLGVAVVMMLGASYVGIWGNFAIVAGAFAGALAVLLIIDVVFSCCKVCRDASHNRHLGRLSYFLGNIPAQLFRTRTSCSQFRTMGYG